MSNEKTINEQLLENLTRKDLINVIALMHDTIEDWNNSLGCSENMTIVLNAVGRACLEHCEEHDFSFPGENDEK